MPSAKYAIGDQLNIVDRNGKVYRGQITSILTYAVAKIISNIEVIASNYASEYSTVDENGLYYTIEPIAGETATFTRVVLWDTIINTDKTTYITVKSVYKLTILPIPVTSGTAARSIDAIIADIKSAIAEKVTDASITYADITETEDDELAMMTKAVDLALEFFDEITEVETIRPLIQDLLKIDFTSTVADIQTSISSIAARLALLDAGGST